MFQSILGKGDHWVAFFVSNAWQSFWKVSLLVQIFKYPVGNSVVKAYSLDIHFFYR